MNRSCAFPDCKRVVRRDHIACRTHWDLVPESLQEDFYASCPECIDGSERHSVWKRIERYLTIRSQIRTGRAA